jgi:hypothetical protein
MPTLDKKALSERDICSKFITPALVAAKWDLMSQIREEVSFTKGRVIVRGQLSTRGDPKRADYLLDYKPGIPLAVAEAKDNNHSVGAGMQQALGYADTLDVPFVFSSNGDAFVFHDRTGQSDPVEVELSLDAFPSPAELWRRYCLWKGLTAAHLPTVEQDYHQASPDKQPRYYQEIAINRAIEAIVKGQDRVLLVMATGTGKTYVASQIIWRLWKAGAKKRILFLADRNILVDQTRINDFKHFGGKMTKIEGRKVDKSYEIYLALYRQDRPLPFRYSVAPDWRGWSEPGKSLNTHCLHSGRQILGEQSCPRSRRDQSHVVGVFAHLHQLHRPWALYHRHGAAEDESSSDEFHSYCASPPGRTTADRCKGGRVDALVRRAGNPAHRRPNRRHPPPRRHPRPRP